MNLRYPGRAPVKSIHEIKIENFSLVFESNGSPSRISRVKLARSTILTSATITNSEKNLIAENLSSKVVLALLVEAADLLFKVQTTAQVMQCMVHKRLRLHLIDNNMRHHRLAQCDITHCLTQTSMKFGFLSSL
jgi:hypothetical protein